MAASIRLTNAERRGCGQAALGSMPAHDVLGVFPVRSPS